MKENVDENSCTKGFFVVYCFRSCLVSLFRFFFYENVQKKPPKKNTFVLFLYEKNLGVCPFWKFCTKTQNRLSNVVHTLYENRREILWIKMIVWFFSSVPESLHMPFSNDWAEEKKERSIDWMGQWTYRLFLEQTSHCWAKLVPRGQCDLYEGR